MAAVGVNAGVGVGVAAQSVNLTTVVTSAVLSAVVAILVAVAVVMAIRQVRRWRSTKAAKQNAVVPPTGRLPASARGSVDTFGFSTSSKFSGRPGLNMEDTDTISNSTVDMNF